MELLLIRMRKTALGLGGGGGGSQELICGLVMFECSSNTNFVCKMF